MSGRIAAGPRAATGLRLAQGWCRVASRVGETEGILGRDLTFAARKSMPSASQSPSSIAAVSASPRIWIIVPTYNERENVGPISEAILATVPQANVLFVDDGSPDGTGELADELARQHPNIAVLHRQAKQGLGRAYVAAFQRRARSRGRRRGPDRRGLQPPGPIPARHCSSPWQPIGPTWCWVPATSRAGHIPRWNILRRLVSRGGSLFAGVVLLMPYRDLTGGFKAFRSSVLRAIDLDHLHAGGYAFQIETTFQARLAGARIIEIPITFEERRAGQSKMSMAIFIEAFRLVLALRVKTLHRRRRTLAVRTGMRTAVLTAFDAHEPC